MINKSTDTPVHGAAAAARCADAGQRRASARAERRATSGVTLGGQTFGAQTTTGVLPAPKPTPQVTPDGAGNYTVDLPAASALMLTR